MYGILFVAKEKGCFPRAQIRRIFQELLPVIYKKKIELIKNKYVQVKINSIRKCQIETFIIRSPTLQPFLRESHGQPMEGRGTN